MHYIHWSLPLATGSMRCLLIGSTSLTLLNKLCSKSSGQECALTFKHEFCDHKECCTCTHILAFANSTSCNIRVYIHRSAHFFSVLFYILFPFTNSSVNRVNFPSHFLPPFPCCLFFRTSFHLGITRCSGMCSAGWFLLRSLCWSSRRERPSANCTSSTMWCRTCWSPWNTSRPPSYASTRTYTWDTQTCVDKLLANIKSVLFCLLLFMLNML